LKKKQIIFWACDYSNQTGEGNLARKFIRYFFYKKKIIVKTLNSYDNLNLKYIKPFIIIIKCWKSYFKGYRVGYVNYLPLWNFCIFLLLPPKTILGPITGGALYTKKNIINFFIRRYIFFIFYKISELIINWRFKNKIIFSTTLLEKFLSEKIKKRSTFNFILKEFKFKKKIRKDIDFIIYFRNHKNKSTFFKYKFLEKLTKLKLKIIVVGDHLNIYGIKNMGYISKKKMDHLQSRSKYTVYSGENILSLFILECISNHVKIFISKEYLKTIIHFKRFFINMDNQKVIKKLGSKNKRVF